MAKRKDTFSTLLYDEITTNGIAGVLREIHKYLDNRNVPLTADDIETATWLRDNIRHALRSREVMSQTIFNSK